MNNLMDSIRRFKAGRLPGGMAPAPERSSGTEELVRMYREVGPGGGVVARRTFEHRWARLAQTERRILVDELLRSGDLPPVVGEALIIFNGTVERLI